MGLFRRRKGGEEFEKISIQDFKQKIIDSLNANIVRIDGIVESTRAKSKKQTFIIQGKIKIESNSASHAINISFVLNNPLATLYLETGKKSVQIKLQDVENEHNSINLRISKPNLLEHNLQSLSKTPDFLDENNNSVTLTET